MSRLEAGLALGETARQLFAPLLKCKTVGVAVSGGADSLALMLLLSDWVKQIAHPPRLIVYSLDHGLRPEAAGEAAFVVETASRLGLAARALRWAGDKPIHGVQAAARAARYRIIGAAMAEDGAELLVTAHHRDDQAETVLMRLAHGSGLAGLRGISEFSRVEGIKVFRPLLGVDPAALRRVVEARGLVAVADPSNTDSHYERVRWRGALPGLAELGLNAGGLAQFARRAGEADAAIGEWADRSFAELVEIDVFGAAGLDRGGFLQLPRAVGVKLMGRLLAIAGGGRRPHDLAAVERLCVAIAGGDDFGGASALGCVVHPVGPVFWVMRELGRGRLEALAVQPRASVFWDGRFIVDNRSDGGVFSVGMARGMTRRAAERLLGCAIATPLAAVRAAPLVTGAGGEILALGGVGLTPEVAIRHWTADAAGAAIGMPD